MRGKDGVGFRDGTGEGRGEENGRGRGREGVRKKTELDRRGREKLI